MSACKSWDWLKAGGICGSAVTPFDFISAAKHRFRQASFPSAALHAGIAQALDIDRLFKFHLFIFAFVLSSFIFFLVCVWNYKYSTCEKNKQRVSGAYGEDEAQQRAWYPSVAIPFS